MSVTLLKQRLLRGAGIIAGFYVLLLIPSPEPQLPVEPRTRPFAWNQDARWRALEAEFASARASGCDNIAGSIDAGIRSTRSLLTVLNNGTFGPDDTILDTLEDAVFSLGPMVAACPSALPA